MRWMKPSEDSFEEEQVRTAVYKAVIMIGLAFVAGCLLFLLVR